MLQAFKQANMSPNADDDPTTLNYSEFLEALGRCALIGYSKYSIRITSL